MIMMLLTYFKNDGRKGEVCIRREVKKRIIINRHHYLFTLITMIVILSSTFSLVKGHESTLASKKDKNKKLYVLENLSRKVFIKECNDSLLQDANNDNKVLKDEYASFLGYKKFSDLSTTLRYTFTTWMCVGQSKNDCNSEEGTGFYNLSDNIVQRNLELMCGQIYYDIANQVSHNDDDQNSLSSSLTPSKVPSLLSSSSTPPPIFYQANFSSSKFPQLIMIMKSSSTKKPTATNIIFKEEKSMVPSKFTTAPTLSPTIDLSLLSPNASSTLETSQKNTKHPSTLSSVIMKGNSSNWHYNSTFSYRVDLNNKDTVYINLYIDLKSAIMIILEKHDTLATNDHHYRHRLLFSFPDPWNVHNVTHLQAHTNRQCPAINQTNQVTTTNTKGPSMCILFTTIIYYHADTVQQAKLINKSIHNEMNTSMHPYSDTFLIALDNPNVIQVTYTNGNNSTTSKSTTTTAILKQSYNASSSSTNTILSSSNIAIICVSFSFLLLIAFMLFMKICKGRTGRSDSRLGASPMPNVKRLASLSYQQPNDTNTKQKSFQDCNTDNIGYQINNTDNRLGAAPHSVSSSYDVFNYSVHNESSSFSSKSSSTLSNSYLNCHHHRHYDNNIIQNDSINNFTNQHQNMSDLTNYEDDDEDFTNSIDILFSEDDFIQQQQVDVSNICSLHDDIIQSSSRTITSASIPPSTSSTSPHGTKIMATIDTTSSKRYVGSSFLEELRISHEDIIIPYQANNFYHATNITSTTNDIHPSSSIKDEQESLNDLDSSAAILFPWSESKASVSKNIIDALSKNRFLSSSVNTTTNSARRISQKIKSKIGQSSLLSYSNSNNKKKLSKDIDDNDDDDASFHQPYNNDLNLLPISTAHQNKNDNNIIL